MADAAVTRLVWLLAGVGLALRLTRYLLAFPLWGDEYQLAANFLDRDFADLLRPLDNNQVAPIGFLWIELAAVKCLGFSELSLRLFPLLCSLASVLLYRKVATRLLQGAPLVLAMAVFAVAYYPIRLGSEMKPYSSDLFLSLVLFAMTIQWWHAPKQSRWLWTMTLVAPLSMAVSFTTAFVAGGLSLGIASTLWRNRGDNGRAAIAAWLTFNIVVALTFAGLMKLNVAAQYAATQGEMVKCWADGFPPWKNPLELSAWLADVHTGEMFAYPIGAEHGGSILTTVCFAWALFEALRRGRREVAITVAGWFALSLVAAAMHRYPYGSHARLSQYLAPAICLFTGAGFGMALSRLLLAAWQKPAFRGSLALCAVIALATVARDALHPYKLACDRDHREFARRFWNAEPETLTICLETDLGRQAYTGSFESAYRCYQRLCSPAHRNGPQSVERALAAADRPLRCVVFHSASAKRDDAVFDSWMNQMLARYTLTGTDTHKVPVSNQPDQLAGYYLLCYDVYHFAPRGHVETSRPPEIMARNPGPVSRAATR